MSATKTTVFNLIILDESGSMCRCVNSTISGCNETINVAKQLQTRNPDTQHVLISIYAFQSGGTPSRYLCKNIPVADARHITHNDYEPGGCTPLFDAVGSTLAELKAVAATHEDATGIVTIITDGMENSSTHYTMEKVVRLIDSLKEMGWTFNFIGANIDVESMSRKMHIDNKMSFSSDEEGTRKMFRSYSKVLMDYEEERMQSEACMPQEERMAYRKQRSSGFFKKHK